MSDFKWTTTHYVPARGEWETATTWGGDAFDIDNGWAWSWIEPPRPDGEGWEPVAMGIHPPKGIEQNGRAWTRWRRFVATETDDTTTEEM